MSEMDDNKVRELLGRYRPIGPSPELRQLVLRNAQPDRIWPWAAVAAVLLMATVAVQFATTNAIGRIAPPSVDPTNALAATMGGDEEARNAARIIVAEQAMREAAWKLTSEFRSVPGVPRWLHANGVK